MGWVDVGRCPPWRRTSGVERSQESEARLRSRRFCVERETSGGGVGGLRRMFLNVSSDLPVEISRANLKWACGGAEFYGGE